MSSVKAQCGTERLVNALLTVQSRIKTGAVDAAALGPFKKSNRPAVVISVVGTSSGKPLKLLPPVVIF